MGRIDHLVDAQLAPAGSRRASGSPGGAAVRRPKLSARTSNNAQQLPSSAPAQHAQNVLDKAFPQANGTGIVVAYGAAAPLSAAQRAAVQAGAQYLSTGNVGLVGKPLVQFTPDRKAAIIAAVLSGDPGQTRYRDNVTAIQDRLSAQGGAMQVRVTGVGGLGSDSYKIFASLDTKLLVGSVAIVLILLLLVYRSPILPLVALLTVGIAYSVATGLLGSERERAALHGQQDRHLAHDRAALRRRHRLRPVADLALPRVPAQRGGAASGARPGPARHLGGDRGERHHRGARHPVVLVRQPADVLVVRAGHRRRAWRSPSSPPSRSYRRCSPCSAGRPSGPRIPRVGQASKHGAWQRVAQAVVGRPWRAVLPRSRCWACWPWAWSPTRPR